MSALGVERHRIPHLRLLGICGMLLTVSIHGWPDDENL